MTMQTFNFPMHTFETIYPDSSPKVQFGKGYEYASKPKAPDQVKYRLAFPVMKFYLTGGVVDRGIYTTSNMALLEDFYKFHRCYEKFIYPHPLEGNVVVRFSQPLQYKQLPMGLGAVEPFTLEFTLQP